MNRRATTLLSITAAFAVAFALPSAALAGDSAGKHGMSFGYSNSSDEDDFEYAVVDAGEDRSVSSSSSGAWSDLQELLDSTDDDVFYFAFHGKKYVVRDPALVARAQTIVRPMQELGAKQGKLGAIQGRLGAQQGKIGARQGVLGGRLALLATRNAFSRHDDTDTGIEIEQIQREMEKLGRQQEELGRKQEPLGAQQAELGKQMERLAKRVGADLRELAEQARGDGKAERL
jgi:bla regulator protein BlaR1